MKTKMAKWIERLMLEYRRNSTVFSLRVTILLLAVAFLLGQRNFWTPDTLFLVMLVVAVVFGQARGFLVRFVPFLAMLLVYDSFRAIADDLNGNVHYWEMIHFDRWLLGGMLPTVLLQSWWWHGSVSWLDFYFYFLYTIHFVVPILTAVLVWKFRDSMYWQYVWAFVVLSFAGFITYVIFPAAPPWLAEQNGYISGVHRISSDIWAAMGVTNFSEVYDKLSPNQVAAMPSLHSAYPLLTVLFVTHIFSFRKTWWTYIYPVSIWIGVVYMGEHYVIDAIAGALYAYGAYYASIRFFDWYNTPSRRFKRWLLTVSARLRPGTTS